MTTLLPPPDSDIQKNLRLLQLHYTADNLADFLTDAVHKNPGQILTDMCSLELSDKTRRGIERRLGASQVGRFKTIDQFDWAWPKEIDRPQIDRLLTLDFVGTSENVIFIGPQGLGKTMIGKNLVWLAIQSGKTALFTSVAKMITELAAAGHQLEAKIRKYTRPDVLMLDELGYLAFQNRSADLLYEVLSRRHEARPTVLTTNLAFKDWPDIFPGASCVVALVDRLTHNAEIVRIDGPSYRQMEAEKRQQRKKTTIKQNTTEKKK